MDSTLFIPRHEGSFELTHNEHKDQDSTVAEQVAIDPYYADMTWVSIDQKQLAIETDSLWTAHWYPDIPTSGHHVNAATLEALSAWLKMHG